MFLTKSFDPRGIMRSIYLLSNFKRSLISSRELMREMVSRGTNVSRES